jgi:hypothetical protein
MPHLCINEKCPGLKTGTKTRANYNYEGNPPAYCGKCKKEDMINVGSSPRCLYIYSDTGKRCSIQPTFNFQNEKGNAKAAYCKKHKDEIDKEGKMIDIRAKICIKCKKDKARYTNLDDKKPLYCFKCKDDSMFTTSEHVCFKCNKTARFCNIEKTIWGCPIHRGEIKDYICPGKKYCQYPDGCIVGPSFGPMGGQPKYCATHMHHELNMINLTHPLCQHQGCKFIAHYNFKGEKGEKFCGVHKDTGMIFLYRKMCTKCNNKYPSFNWEGEVTPLYCGECAPEGMINVSSPNCHFEGCKFQPSFNFEGFTRPIYCTTHKDDNMVCVVRSPCQHAGCPSRHPCFNYSGETKGLYCVRHKKDNMINVKKDECLGGCGVIPSYNYPGFRPKYCKRCKSDDMIEVIHNRCQHKDCNGRKMALFNFPGEKLKLYCSQHKESGMINLTTKRCAHPKCSDAKIATGALYGLPGQETIYCNVHKDPGMIIFPHKKCIHPECSGKEPAIFAIKSRAEYCEQHAPEGYMCIINNPCKGCNLLDIVDKEGYCPNCHPDTFQNYRYAKQRQVVAWLNANGQIDYESIDTCPSEIMECKEGHKYGYRPDVFYDMGSYYIIIEIDEKQHNTEEYKACELPRMINIQQALALPTIFIRYNPDSYKVQDKIQITSKEKKLSTLLNWLKHAKEVPPTEQIQVAYLYYDEYDEHNTQYKTIDILSVAKSLADTQQEVTTNNNEKKSIIILKKKPSLFEGLRKMAEEKKKDEFLPPTKLIFKRKITAQIEA